MDNSLSLAQIIALIKRVGGTGEGGSGEGGTTNYNDLENKPSINGTALVGALTSKDLGLELTKEQVNELVDKEIEIYVWEGIETESTSDAEAISLFTEINEKIENGKTILLIVKKTLLDRGLAYFLMNKDTAEFDDEDHKSYMSLNSGFRKINENNGETKIDGFSYRILWIIVNGVVLAVSNTSVSENGSIGGLAVLDAENRSNDVYFKPEYKSQPVSKGYLNEELEKNSVKSFFIPKGVFYFDEENYIEVDDDGNETILQEQPEIFSTIKEIFTLLEQDKEVEITIGSDIGYDTFSYLLSKKNIENNTVESFIYMERKEVTTKYSGYINAMSYTGFDIDCTFTINNNTKEVVLYYADCKHHREDYLTISREGDGKEIFMPTEERHPVTKKYTDFLVKDRAETKIIKSIIGPTNKESDVNGEWDVFNTPINGEYHLCFRYKNTDPNNAIDAGVTFRCGEYKNGINFTKTKFKCIFKFLNVKFSVKVNNTETFSHITNTEEDKITYFDLLVKETDVITFELSTTSAIQQVETDEIVRLIMYEPEDTTALIIPKILGTGIDYEEPYMPEYDGSPATKAYVDSLVNNNTNIFVWDGQSSTANPDNLELWKKIIAKAEEKMVVVFVKADDYYKKGCFIFKNGDIDKTKTVQYKQGLVCSVGLTGTSSVININIKEPRVELHFENQILTSVAEIANSGNILPVLPTKVYSSTIPFIPTENAQPTTKKYVDDAIISALANITGLTPEIVTELPTTGNSNKIYLILKENMEENSNDIYDEYLWINNKYEHIGSTDMNVDLTPYATKQWVKDEIPKILHLRNSYETEEELITVLQEAVDEHNNGKDVIILSNTELDKENSSMSDVYYFPSNLTLKNNKYILSGGVANLTNHNITTGIGSSTYSGLSHFKLEITVVNNIVTEYDWLEYDDTSLRVLEVNKNYGTPYTPQYPGSPATKKYTDEAVERIGIYYWNGKSSTDDPEVLELWKEIINKVKTEQKSVLVYSNNLTNSASYYNAVFVVSPANIFKNSLAIYGLANYFSHGSVSNSCVKTASFYRPQVTLLFTDGELTTVNTLRYATSGLSKYLTTDNTADNEIEAKIFIPTQPGQPASKKYVDDSIGNVSIYWDGKSGTNNPDNIALWQKIYAIQKLHDVIVYKDNKSMFIIKQNTMTENGTFTFKSGLKSVQRNGLAEDGSAKFLRITSSTSITITNGVITEVGGFLDGYDGEVMTVLTTGSNTAQNFTPTNPMHPATKKYVDEIVGDIGTILDSINGEVI